MKSNKVSKLSPLEELRQKKAILQQECKVEEQKLLLTVGEIRSNWKGLLVSSVFSSSKSLVHSFFSTSDGKRDKLAISAKVLPIVWGILQPILIKIAMNKIKNLFIKKKK